MSDSLRSLRWRAAIGIAGLIVALVGYSAMGLGDHHIRIEFGIAPEILVGAAVVIDGEVAGSITRPRAPTVNGFPVEPGEHTVELRLEGYGAESITVDTRTEGGTARLMVDFSERRNADGSTQPTIVLY
ncbi:MAG: PEGA domain-containing protein [Gemmatimonadetes bacterium]|nr:PEGA domain-containing protein [Gemmatimonadota bacterium]MDA1104934.1 PEGA domain-containing protein [Gemmatimonadota bacterium]